MSLDVRPDDAVVTSARSDPRPRWRRLAAPLGTGLGVAAACAVVYAVDPNEPGHYPVCPTRLLFGIDCPGCGMLRGTHDLLHGDLAGAADHNLLLFALVPIAVVLWVRWLRESWSGERPAVTLGQSRMRNRAMIIGLVVVLAFGVLRWFVPYLGSGLSGA